MTTAIKLDLNYPVLKSVPVNNDQTNKTASMTHPLLRESRDIFELMGWEQLPESIKLVIAIDLVGFRDELNGLYSTKDPYVLARRRTIYYWINQYLHHICSADTVEQALEVLNLGITNNIEVQ